MKMNNLSQVILSVALGAILVVLWVTTASSQQFRTEQIADEAITEPKIDIADSPATYDRLSWNGSRFEFFPAEVGVDAAAVPGFIGATDGAGVIRVSETDGGLTKVDGGDFITVKGPWDRNTGVTPVELGFRTAGDVMHIESAIAGSNLSVVELEDTGADGYSSHFVLDVSTINNQAARFISTSPSGGTSPVVSVQADDIAAMTIDSGDGTVAQNTKTLAVTNADIDGEGTNSIAIEVDTHNTGVYSATDGSDVAAVFGATSGPGTVGAGVVGDVSGSNYGVIAQENNANINTDAVPFWARSRGGGASLLVSKFDANVANSTVMDVNATEDGIDVVTTETDGIAVNVAAAGSGIEARTSSVTNTVYGLEADHANIEDYLDLEEVSAPATPPTATSRIYAKADGTPYAKDDAGAEYGLYTSIAKSGSSALTGDVTLSAGSNVTLTQAGQNIEIASTGGGGGSPGGADTNVQYNDLGAFGGDSGFTYDGAGQTTLTNTGGSQIVLNATGGSLFAEDSAIDFKQDGTTQFYLGFDDGNNTFQLDVTGGFSTTPAFGVTSSKFVGIGTYQPDNRLTILDNGTSTTTPGINIKQTSTGDSLLKFDNVVQQWAVGLDNSDSDKFKISDNSSLGTNDRLTIDTTGVVDVPTGLKVGGSTVTANNILDEDTMVTDSATALATQQSIKAYVDSSVSTKMGSFDVVGDQGAPETVTDGSLLTIAGGAGVTTESASTTTVNININAPESQTYWAIVGNNTTSSGTISMPWSRINYPATASVATVTGQATFTGSTSTSDAGSYVSAAYAGWTWTSTQLGGFMNTGSKVSPSIMSRRASDTVTIRALVYVADTTRLSKLYFRYNDTSTQSSSQDVLSSVSSATWTWVEWADQDVSTYNNDIWVTLTFQGTSTVANVGATDCRLAAIQLEYK